MDLMPFGDNYRIYKYYLLGTSGIDSYFFSVYFGVSWTINLLS